MGPMTQFFQHINGNKRDDGGTYRLKDETYQANAMCLFEA